MPLSSKRWFQILIGFILVFALIWLMNITSFIFDPIFSYIGAVALPIIGAGVLFYLTKPLMHLFQRFKIKQIPAILLVFLVILIVISIFVIYIAPIAQSQFKHLMDNIPMMVDWAQNSIKYVQNNQTMIPQEVNQAIDNFTNNLQSHIENAINYIFGFIGQLISIILAVVLIPLFLFFMLKDGEKLIPFITQIFSKKKAKNISSLFTKIDTVLSAFIQGQLLVSLFVGIGLLIGYLLIGLNYSLTLALFALIMNVIPFAGPFIAVIPALIVGAIQDPIMLLWVAIITLIVQQIESNLISPNVMGRALSLHPLTVITVILAAGSIAGFIGILFAVPLYAVVKTIIVHFYNTYRKSNEDDYLI